MLGLVVGGGLCIFVGGGGERMAWLAVGLCPVCQISASGVRLSLICGLGPEAGAGVPAVRGWGTFLRFGAWRGCRGAESSVRVVA